MAGQARNEHRAAVALAIALAVLAATGLSGCPARRGTAGPPPTLDPTFLDRA